MNDVQETPPVNDEKPKSIFGVIIHSFFIIPFLIAVFCVLLFAAVSLLTHEKQTAYDLLNDVKTTYYTFTSSASVSGLAYDDHSTFSLPLSLSVSLSDTPLHSESLVMDKIR